MTTNNCIEFKVKQNESAHFNVQNFNFQDNIRYSINISETIRPENFICIYYNFTTIPKIYLGNTDTDPNHSINKRQPARWKVIQKVMIDNNIKEVTIKLCPFEGKTNPKIVKTKKTQKTLNKINIENLAVEKKIDELLKPLDLDKLNPKLLIIGCSDSKTSGGINQIVNNYFDNENYNNLIIDRIISFHDYDNLLINSPNYFIHKSINPDTPIKRNNIPVQNNYFAECRNNNLFLPAIERYAGGTFYTQQLRELYCKKNDGANLHILIISGLYGIIEFRDSIIDYHLKINTLNFWNNQSILESVKQYIEENKIDDNLVFYSLSNFYKKALKPKKNWKNLWISAEGARRANLGYSAKYVSKFLNRLP